MEPVFSLKELALGLALPDDGNTEGSKESLSAWHDWVDWNGEGTPNTGLSNYVILKLRDGTITGRLFPRHADWKHCGAKDDIVAYKRCAEVK